MVIDGIFVYHFLDRDLRVEIISRKEGTAENRGTDFEIWDVGTSAHWFWRLKKFHAEPVCFLLPFWSQKMAFKRPFE